MSGGKKRSGFQITSVTSDFNLQTPAGQSAPSVVLPVLQSAASSCGTLQGSSSQPTTPSLKRKYISHDASAGGGGCSSRFRVVRLAVGGAGSGGRGEPYRRGRWTCTDFTERQEVAGFRRVMDTMRHAHSLESLEMIGRDIERGGGYKDLTPPLHLLRPAHETSLLLCLDVDAAGRSVLRLSHSQPSSPPAGLYHPTLTPVQTPAAFSLDQTIFNLPGEPR
ncbi:TSC22 domain family protein 4 TSC22-related-inducible leucine zipper protein 2 [Collichthys lucidus]|uniref:TSC22 domain family protein 4 TSC22-related-inducible leucine zipper protein 2 n=1 Tax=Collichthys lucidus TaxID=240159 RepID=A0A4U5VWX3_COLLU|nr:TSC22 domain family protein 4 TSC22-related-inducible leucine zipper protein 2 [Collichthys lucidus]